MPSRLFHLPTSCSDETAAAFRRWLGTALVGCTLFASALGCRGQSSIQRVPGVEFIPVARPHKAADYFIAVDAKASPDGAEDILWVAGDYDAKGPRLWHAARLAPGMPWSYEQQVDSAKVLSAKCVVAADGVHALFPQNGRLRHRMSQNHLHWLDQPNVSRDDEQVLTFDALASGRSIVVAYLAYDENDSIPDWYHPPTRLVVVRIDGDGQARYDDLITLPYIDRFSAGPMLMATQGGLRLVVVTSFPAGPLTDNHVPFGPFRTRLMESRMSGVDDAWAKPSVVPLDVASPDGNIAGYTLNAAATYGPGGTFVFFDCNGLMAIHGLDNGLWEAPRRIGKYAVLESSMWERTIAAAADSAGLTLIWCDTRNAAGPTILGVSSERWEPEVLLLSASGKDATLDALAAAQPLRLSSKGYAASSVGVSPWQGRLQLYWTENRPPSSGRTFIPEQSRIGSLTLSR